MTEVMQVREAYRVEQWRQLMQQRKDSPLNNREFCAQQGISEKSNYYWLKKRNRQNRQRLDRHGTIVSGSFATFHHYNVQGVK